MVASEHTPQTLTKKTVILVHGMGDRKKNSLLFKVANVIAAWMERHATESPAQQLEHPKHPTLDEHLNGTGASSVDLKFRGQHWEFLEVWWADAVDPPNFDPLIGWTFQQAILQLIALIGAMIKRSLIPFALVLLVILPYIVAVAALTLVVLGASLFGVVLPSTDLRVLLSPFLSGVGGFFIKILERPLRTVDEHLLSARNRK